MGTPLVRPGIHFKLRRRPAGHECFAHKEQRLSIFWNHLHLIYIYPMKLALGGHRAQLGEGANEYRRESFSHPTRRDIFHEVSLLLTILLLM